MTRQEIEAMRDRILPPPFVQGAVTLSITRTDFYGLVNAALHGTDLAALLTLTTGDQLREAFKRGLRANNSGEFWTEQEITEASEKAYPRRANTDPMFWEKPATAQEAR